MTGPALAQPERPAPGTTLDAMHIATPTRRHVAVREGAAMLLRPSSVPAPGRAPGDPLDPQTRSRMESLFRADFSRVRLHTEASEPQAPTFPQAPAFTIGNDIYLPARPKQPDAPADDWILAHELAHVVQQAGSAEGRAPAASMEAAERDASAAADAVQAKEPFSVRTRTGPRAACAPPTRPPSAPLPGVPASGVRIIREWAAPDGFVIDIEVGPAVSRLGLENTLPSGTEVGLKGWQRAHSSGAGLGAESGRAIRYAPPDVNLKYQAGVERFIRDFNRERDTGVRLFLRSVTTTHPRSLRLESITYRLSASRGNGPVSTLFTVTINVSNSRDNPKVSLSDPDVGVDWTAFLRPRAPRAPRPARGTPPSSTPASPRPAAEQVEPAAKSPSAPTAESAKGVARVPSPAPMPKPEVFEAETPPKPTAVPARVTGDVESPHITVPRGGGAATGLALFQIGMLLLQFLPDPLEQQRFEELYAKALAEPRIQARFAELDPQVHASPGVVYYVMTVKLDYYGHKSFHPKLPEVIHIEAVRILDVKVSPVETKVTGDLEESPRRIGPGGYGWNATRVVTVSVLPVRPEIGPTYGLRKDSEIRDAVRNADATTLARMPVEEKFRIVNRLLDGWVSDDDLDAVESIYRAAPPPQRPTLTQVVQARIPSLWSIGQRTRLRAMLVRHY